MIVTIVLSVPIGKPPILTSNSTGKVSSSSIELSSLIVKLLQNVSISLEDAVNGRASPSGMKSGPGVAVKAKKTDKN